MCVCSCESHATEQRRVLTCDACEVSWSDRDDILSLSLFPWWRPALDLLATCRMQDGH
jgi:hypothetical protein